MGGGRGEGNILKSALIWLTVVTTTTTAQFELCLRKIILVHKGRRICVFHTFRERHACPSSSNATTSSGSLLCLGLGAIRNNGGLSHARKGQACHARTNGIGEMSGFSLVGALSIANSQ